MLEREACDVHAAEKPVLLRLAGIQHLETRIEARLPQVVRMLAKDFGATRVLLFGRHARGVAGPESDVDLLVEGLPLARIILETAVDRFVLHVTIGMSGQLRLSEASPSG